MLVCLIGLVVWETIPLITITHGTLSLLMFVLTMFIVLSYFQVAIMFARWKDCSNESNFIFLLLIVCSSLCLPLGIAFGIYLQFAGTKELQI
ncbi:hypothetical protein AB4238_13535 [Shewanella sp. 10N.286.45.A1]|uniref:hypothetical protein n=1 Tax=Shewanella sp. 10N.286.45.A1 TaxID=3229694 RepID=UPI00354ADB24